MNGREQQPATWIERLARLGYTVKGIVYAIIGVLAVQAAFNLGGRTTGSEGALQTVAAQPFGQFLLWVMAIGLVGYVIWRFIQAIRDPEHRGHDAKDIGRRIGYAISGIIYGALAFTAARIAMGAAQSSGGNSSTQSAVARLMAQPFGQWLVGALGALIIGLGFYYFYQAYRAKFRRKLKTHEMSLAEEKWAVRISQFGIAARGVVFVIIGGFLIQAARYANPSRARSSQGALEALEQQPYGPWLLGIVALGLIAYGIYMWIQARYRRIEVS